MSRRTIWDVVESKIRNILQKWIVAVEGTESNRLFNSVIHFVGIACFMGREYYIYWLVYEGSMGTERSVNRQFINLSIEIKLSPVFIRYIIGGPRAWVGDWVLLVTVRIVQTSESVIWVPIWYSTNPYIPSPTPALNFLVSIWKILSFEKMLCETL